ncbi:unnamed protein product [Pelagomonas calceolata]|uniref:YqgF/RNase H-like domain-containing protein n=2 Tax=Pelagomonas calceolata TaxID=35677 RepID=A0A8J2T1I1_9STRA|nr:unnamed protein product [Pelagomonas calceolata]
MSFPHSGAIFTGAFGIRSFCEEGFRRVLEHSAPSRKLVSSSCIRNRAAHRGSMRRWLLVATLVAGARPLAPPRIAPPTLGVDYGLRRVGVCVGVGFASRPLEVIEHDEDIDAVVARLLQIARRERIASIVVGLPLEKDGAEGLQCAATRRFADALAAAAPATPLVLWDERFSSREAEALLAHRPGAALDAVAACVILDDFFASADDGAAAPPAPPAPAPAAPPKRRPRPKPRLRYLE